MTTGQGRPRRWRDWTIEIKVWKILIALVILPILVLWFKVVHQDDEILALVRNEVVTDVAGQRSWAGSFVNTNDRTLRDVAVTVDFLGLRIHSVQWRMGQKAVLMGPFRSPWEFGYLMGDPARINR